MLDLAELFQRGKNRIRLTETGELAVKYARELLEETDVTYYLIALRENSHLLQGFETL